MINAYERATRRAMKTAAQTERARARRADCRAYVLNGLALYAIALLIMLQVDVDGEQLIQGWKGLHAAMLAIFALAGWQWFKASRLIVGAE